MQRVVVTGATSMIGVATIEECIHHNIPVVAILRKNSSRESRLPKSDLLTKIYLEVSDFQSVYVEGTADVLYHFMWEFSHKEGRDNPLLQEKNIKTTLDVVNFAHNLGCKRIVFAGSQAEYGPVRGIMDENDPIKPQNAYGMAKHAASMLAFNLCQQYNIDAVWTRIFSVYGRYDNADTMINSTIEKLLKGERVEFSSGVQSWNFLNEHDAGRIFYSLGQDNVVPGLYNVAHPQSRKLKDYINDILSFFPEAEYSFANDNGTALGIHSNTKKIFEQIGNVEMIPFKDRIQEIIEYKKLSGK